MNSQKPKKTLLVKEVGKVIEISGQVLKITGLPYVSMGELLDIEGKRGIVLSFNKDFTYALLLEKSKDLKPSILVRRTKEVLKVPVGEEFIGKTIDPLGRDIDTRAVIETGGLREIEKSPPEIMEREQIREPLETGIKIIDALFPIGRGQRELIVGDRKTGKTTLVLDTILNQKNVICIYTAIGQRRVEIVQILKTLREQGALSYTIVVVASSSDSSVLQYLAPFSAMTMAEYFRDQGKDVLVVFDDLTKHAWVWRELSLLLERPPGREAYPGDIFYLHARLLERAAKLNKDYGGGSISALPICETKEGDISEYIPTNLISITDGQLYLEADLFQKGVKPAINIGLSVSRVGSRAQRKCIKEITQGLKLILSQHKELKKLLQLETKISIEAQKKLQRGEILLEIFKQQKQELIDTANQSIIYFAVLNGFLDTMNLKNIKKFESHFYEFVNDLYPEFKKEVLKDGWTRETKAELEKIIKEFKLME
ncbi:MAG: F0F1 ATP synthase subunit alpha [Candidatus Paceibacterales bacterium]